MLKRLFFISKYFLSSANVPKNGLWFSFDQFHLLAFLIHPLKEQKSLKTNQTSADTNSHNALPLATTLCTPHDRLFCILYSALKHQICSLPLLTNIPFNFDKYPLLISAMLRIEENNWELLFW